MKRELTTIILIVLGLVTACHQDQAQNKPAEKAPSERPPVKVQVSKEKEGHDAQAAGQDQAKEAPKRYLKRGIVPLANTNKVTFTNLYMMASYIMGVQMASSIKMQGVTGDYVDPELFIMGIRDVFGGRMPLVDMNTAENVSSEFEKEMRVKYDQRVKDEAVENLKMGREFMADNKKKEGVVTTLSGLQYRILKDGSGESPKDGDKIAFHFRGKTIDGDEFSNSYRHKEAPVVPVDRQILGLREALKMMKPGARWEVYVPSELGYGSRDVGKGVGANATLIFEIELIEISKDRTLTEPKKYENSGEEKK